MRTLKFIVCFLCILTINDYFIDQSIAQELSISNLYQANKKSIVLIGTKNKKQKNNSSGSGFIINKKGWIVTNYHVIKKAKKILVKTNDSNTLYEAKLISADEDNDIALVEIKADNLHPVTLTNSNLVKIGDRVVAIGNPLGLENTLSDGLISAIREVNKDVTIFQISAPLSPGSSGGPLFNLKGEVIGVTTATLSGGQALNFAVPSNYILKLLKTDSKNIQTFKKKRGKLHHQYHSQAYIIEKGDTLYSISKKFNTNTDLLIKNNNLKNELLIKGQLLRVPNN